MGGRHAPARSGEARRAQSTPELCDGQAEGANPRERIGPLAGGSHLSAVPVPRRYCAGCRGVRNLSRRALDGSRADASATVHVRAATAARAVGSLTAGPVSARVGRGGV